MQVVGCLCVQITSGTPLKHSLSAMFVYIRVPPINPINARAPSLGPRLSLFSKVSYMLLQNIRIGVDETLEEWHASHTRGVVTFSRTRTKNLEGATRGVLHYL